ncbi:hypothetical protein B0H13DRAFT_700122 [Mycena leptocephala]|nr:hypothetical protein B0H13DRAFT_700122 [Mycena leptocephala]
MPRPNSSRLSPPQPRSTSCFPATAYTPSYSAARSPPAPPRVLLLLRPTPPATAPTYSVQERCGDTSLPVMRALPRDAAEGIHGRTLSNLSGWMRMRRRVVGRLFFLSSFSCPSPCPPPPAPSVPLPPRRCTPAASSSVYSSALHPSGSGGFPHASDSAHIHMRSRLRTQRVRRLQAMRMRRLRQDTSGGQAADARSVNTDALAGWRAVSLLPIPLVRIERVLSRQLQRQRAGRGRVDRGRRWDVPTASSNTGAEGGPAHRASVCSTGRQLRRRRLAVRVDGRVRPV